MTTEKIFQMDAEETVSIIINNVAYHVMGYEILALIEMQGEDIEQYLNETDRLKYLEALGL